MQFKKWSNEKLALDEAVSMGEMVNHIGDCYDEIDRSRQACAGLRGLADRASQYQSERDRLAEAVKAYIAECGEPCKDDTPGFRRMAEAVCDIWRKPV